MSPRLPLRDLREARADPARYRNKLLNPPRGGGPNYFNALRDAIFNFHKAEWTAAEAEWYLEGRLNSLPDTVGRADVSDQFRWYVGEYEARGWTTFHTRMNVSIPLPSWVSANLSVSGEIARIDLVPSGGYAGWVFLSGDAEGWRDDPRMPLIQEELTQKMNAADDEVSVGVYALRERSAELTRYYATEIEKTRSSLEELLQQLRL